MIQTLCRSLAAAVLVSATGVPLSAHAEPAAQDAYANSQETLEIAAEQSDPAATELVPQDNDSARLEADTLELSEIFQITTHTVDERRIAILHIDDLPTLTFVEKTTDAAMAPASRAEQVAQHLEQVYQADSDADAILVRWDEALEEYAITLDGETVVLINDTTQYFNPTGEAATDALQATNRLRMLLGAPEALTEIEGQPAPEIAAPADWGVASVFSGQASWYGPGFHGRQTASGERFNQNAMTAAHRTLPFGTRVRVINVHNNSEIIVRINDRGPFSRGRVIDLSAAAAREIGLDRAGVGPVRVEVLAD